MAYHQIDNRQNGKLAKCLVDKMANWPNGKLKKWPLCGLNNYC